MSTDQTSATPKVIKCDKKGTLDDTCFYTKLDPVQIDLSIFEKIIEKIDALDKKINRIFGDHVFIDGKIVQSKI